LLIVHCVHAISNIGGGISVFAGQTGLNYSVTSGGGLITWSVTGGSIASGQGTNAIVVDWGSAAGFGSIVAVETLISDTSDTLIVTITTTDTLALVWERTYDAASGGFDIARTVKVDASGNVYVAGACGTNGFTDLCVVKYDANGAQQWVAKYDGGGFDGYTYWLGNLVSQIKNIMDIDDSGNVYITGTSGADIATVKFNAAGAQQWASIYSGPGQDYGMAITVDGSGNVYVTGVHGKGGFPKDLVAIKYNSAGVEQWARTYNGTSSGGNDVDGGLAITVDASGNVYVTGESNNSATNFDGITIKYDAAGNELWASIYTGGFQARCYSVAVDDNGNVYVTGSQASNWNGLFVVKYNSSGVEQWVYTDNSSGAIASGDAGNEVMVDGSGNIYVTGAAKSTPPSGGGTHDYSTINLNAAGEPQWTATFDGIGTQAWNHDDAKSMALDANGNIFITGKSGSSNYVTLVYNSEGISQWYATYSVNQIHTSANQGIAVDDNCCFYITGAKNNGGLDYDFLTIKYCIPNVLIADFLASDTSICGSECISFFDLSDSTASSWQWSFPGATPSTSSLQNPANICYDTPGFYDVTLVAAGGCATDTKVKPAYIETKQLPIVDIGNDTTICTNEPLQLNAGNPGSTYQWSTGEISQTITIDTSGTYGLRVTHANGCQDSATIVVNIGNCYLFIPNSFSPNGDGVNDVLFVRASGIKNILLRIYNRWGEKVFETNDITQGWDGTYKGKELSPGVFVYYIKGVFEETTSIYQKGNVTLIR